MKSMTPEAYALVKAVRRFVRGEERAREARRELRRKPQRFRPRRSMGFRKAASSPPRVPVTGRHLGVWLDKVGTDRHILMNPYKHTGEFVGQHGKWDHEDHGKAHAWHDNEYNYAQRHRDYEGMMYHDAMRAAHGIIGDAKKKGGVKHGPRQKKVHQDLHPHLRIASAYARRMAPDIQGIQF